MGRNNEGSFSSPGSQVILSAHAASVAALKLMIYFYIKTNLHSSVLKLKVSPSRDIFTISFSHILMAIMFCMCYASVTYEYLVKDIFSFSINQTFTYYFGATQKCFHFV